MKFNEFLKKKRKQARMNKSLLAEKTGLSVSSITRLEAGEYLPTIETIEKLGDVLGEKEKFYFYAKKIPQNTETIMQVVDFILKGDSGDKMEQD
ncbi:MAG: XRE family transcriptional regulator [Planctomycetota bacterium]|nr:MAG: XRE family transcriptional regulator [Planctomycetota bacterium]